MLQNFDVYFPVQLWISRDASHYRLQPPLLGFKDEYRFSPRFWDDVSGASLLGTEDHEKLEAYWTLHTTLWGFNGKYSPSLNRGFATVAVLNNNATFPLETEKVSVFRNGSSFYSSWEAYTNSFGFAVYSYPVPGTRLLYVHNDRTTLRILFLVLCGKDGCPTLPDYRFLPNQDNKSVSCYDIAWDNFNLFFYVFPEKPRGPFFRLTETGLCVPSEHETDHKSMLECIHASAGMRVLPKNIFTGSPLSEMQQVMYTYPLPSTTLPMVVGGVTASVFCFLVSLVVLLLVARPIKQ